MKLLAAFFAVVIFAGPLWGKGEATERVNSIRAQQGLVPLERSAKLDQAAQSHAADMFKRGYFAHKGANGSTAGKRVRRAGYKWCIVAENIAKGQKNVAAALKAWRNSPGHYKNMTLRKVREYGIARSGDVWVMVLAARRC